MSALVAIDFARTMAARDFGARVVAGYARGDKPRSAALCAPGVPHITHDVFMQTAGRLGEIALAIFLGLDPMAVLDWGAACDDGRDLVIGTHSLDIKTSPNPRAELLLWPASKPFGPAASLLVGARLEPGTTSECVRLQGWISADSFARNARRVGQGRALAPGTLYMHVDDLAPMPALLTRLARQ